MDLFVRRRWPLVTAAVAALAVVALGVWLLARGGSAGSPAAGPSPTPVPTGDDVIVETAEPLSDPPTSPPVAMDALLAAPSELKSYAGRGVTATDVPVLERIGPSVAWVGTARNRLLIVLVATEHPFAFGPGAPLTFTGSVHRASPGSSRTFGLSGADAAAFEAQGAYVEVTEYVVS
jgi:hypothetical protein